MGRVRELFNKQRPGFVSGSPEVGYLIVREKAFKAWVRRNALRFLATVSELSAKETEYQKSWDDYYQHWNERDLSGPAEDPFDVMSTFGPDWADF